MKILLINPWIYDFAAYDLWMKPLGLFYLASFLEESSYDVSLINCMDRHHPDLRKKFADKLPRDREYDCGKFFGEEVEKPEPLKNVPRKYRRYGITPDIFEAELRKISPPDLIGVTSGMTYWYPGVFEVIREVKSFFPAVPVVLGGVYATLCHQHAREFSGADYIIKGRGELEFLKLADKIAGVRRNYSSASFGENDLPYPAYHLMSKVKSVSLVSSFGCPFRCTYCASRLLQPIFYQRKPLKVIQEIDYFTHNFGVKDFAFYDDALLVNPEKHIGPILDMIIKRFKDIRFHTPNGLHASYIDGGLARRLYQASFKTIRLSFETSDLERQKDSYNKVSNQDLIRAVENLKTARYRASEIEVYVMIGLPGQNFEEIIDTMKFVHRLKVKIRVVQFSPIPGTKEYDKAVTEYGFNGDEPLLQNNSLFPMQTKKMNYQKFFQIKNLVTELNSELN